MQIDYHRVRWHRECEDSHDENFLFNPSDCQWFDCSRFASWKGRLILIQDIDILSRPREDGVEPSRARLRIQVPIDPVLMLNVGHSIHLVRIYSPRVHLGGRGRVDKSPVMATLIYSSWRQTWIIIKIPNRRESTQRTWLLTLKITRTHKCKNCMVL